MTDKKVGYSNFEKQCTDNSSGIHSMHEDLKDLKNGEYKIFVGNVPYQCTQEEFARCFQDVDGFIKAEIITVYKTNMSRGFGFVTMRSMYDAENLKQRDDIMFKGRALRFTSYQNENSKLVMENLNNYVFVDGIPEGKNRDWLRNCFSTYEPIGKCFVTMNHENGEMKGNGVIEIIDDSKYKNILAKKWHDVDGITLETSKYRTKLPHMLGFIDDTMLSQSHTHNTGQINVYGNNRVSGSRYYPGSQFNPQHKFYDRSCDRALGRDVSQENNSRENIKVSKAKRTNKNEIFSAFIAGKNAGIIQGMKMAKISHEKPRN